MQCQYLVFDFPFLFWGEQALKQVESNPKLKLEITFGFPTCLIRFIFRQQDDRLIPAVRYLLGFIFCDKGTENIPAAFVHNRHKSQFHPCLPLVLKGCCFPILE
jgi:hypothetical protein